MRIIKNAALLVLVIAVSACQQRYFLLERPEFSSKMAEVDRIQHFLNADTTRNGMYKFYFCETEESEEGIKFRAFNPCPADDREAISRVASLLFIDDERVIYITSDVDWDTIADQIHLEHTYNRVKEGFKPNRKHSITYFRGYYRQVKNGNLVVTLDEGVAMSLQKAKKLNAIRDRTNDRLGDETLKKIFGAARRNMTSLHFKTDAPAPVKRLELLSIDYHDDDFGLDFKKPLTKKATDIFSSRVFFNFETTPQKTVHLLYKTDRILQIEPFHAATKTGKVYRKADGSVILEEPTGERKDIRTW